MRRRWIHFRAAVALSLVLLPGALKGEDKNGVSPQVISLPSGPGSIQGLGESFQPQLNNGGGSYSIPIKLPPGVAGHAPSITLKYDSGAGNGCLGVGWSISGVPFIGRNLDRGLPRYVDADNGVDDDGDGLIDNGEELDRFTGVDQEELVPVAGGFFRSENEANFVRYARSGGGWEARTKGGVRHELGLMNASQVASEGRVYRWLLERSIDLHGNTIDYEYRADSASLAQRYIRSIRWGGEAAGYGVAFAYSDRPDVFSDYRSTFELSTSLRLTRIDVFSTGLPVAAGVVEADFNADGQQDALIRRYVLDYDDQGTVSLLRRVTQFGRDGVSQLPPTTFEYSGWVPPDDVSGYFITSKNEPAGIGLNSPNVELIDLNADALPDFLSTTAGVHVGYLNFGVGSGGELEWDLSGSFLLNAPTIELASPTVHLADADADGLADLVVKDSAATFGYYRNNGNTGWTSSILSVGYSDSAPLWPFENGGAASRTVDLDHNRLSDVVYTDQNAYRIWHLLSSGRYAQEMQVPPLFANGSAFHFEQPGAHIADLNGDRLQDFAWVQQSQIVYWPNQGRGQFGEPVELFLGSALSVEDIAKSGFADVNGDGLVDLTVVRPDSNLFGLDYWLNRSGLDLDQRRAIDGLPGIQANDSLRWADMNGNGSTDIVISNSTLPQGERNLVIDLVPGTRPNLLTRIDNGLGLVTSLHYSTSVEQMVAAADTFEPWSQTMPISIPLVSQIVEDDPISPAYVRNIRYRDPYFDPQKQEFRGFAHAEVEEVGDDSAPTRITKHWFNTGQADDCLKGRPEQQETLNAEGDLFLREVTVWAPQVLVIGVDSELTPVCFAAQTATDSFVYEGTPQSVQIRTEFEFDDFGNMTEQRAFGIVEGENLAAGRDEVITTTQFLHDATNWIVDRQCSVEIADLVGSPKARRRMFYDGQGSICPGSPLLSRGNLTREESWLDTEDRYIPVVRNQYDSFGNIIQITDANGHSRSLGYDAILHMYPVQESVHLADYDLNFLAHYDLSFGTVTHSTDFAGAETAYEYDPLARLTAIRRPAGAEETYEYHLASPVSHIVKRVLESIGGGTFDSYSYFDGFGRPLGSKLEAEDGLWRYLDVVEYNSRKLAHRKWLPYHVAAVGFESPDDLQPFLASHFDVRDRVLRTINPDSTFSRTVFEPLVRHVWDENDNAGAATPASYRNDSRDLLIEVTERNGPETYLTNYAWSTLGNLITITDAQNNVRTFSYDSLRRKVGLCDPNRGPMSYDYDDVGNLIRTQDAKAQIILFGYDFANRLLTENYLDKTGDPATDPLDVVYTYDLPSSNIDFGDTTMATAAFTGGRLASVQDLSGEEHRSYDARGNLAWIVKSIRDPRLDISVPFGTRFAYDTMDRLTELIYPDNDRVLYHYNDASLTERIDGGPGGKVLLSNVDYEPTGQQRLVDFGNGVVSTYGFDSRDRLSMLLTVSPVSGELINYGYSYDPASNITKIEDGRPFAGQHGVPADSPRRNTQFFRYDDLYRLTQVKYSPLSDGVPTHGQIDYAYDAIGNLLTSISPASGEPGHIAQAGVNQGKMTVGGGPDGAFDRVCRNLTDPIGPHILTATSVGGVYEYDANANMTRLGDAALTWDFKDRLVRYERGNVSGKYAYDYTNRRVLKAVRGVGDEIAATYQSPYFEIQAYNAPSKYVVVHESRLAQVQETIDPTREHVQRIALSRGWNLVTLGVLDQRSASLVLGNDAIAWIRDGEDYVRIPASAPVPPSKPVWVSVENPKWIVALGSKYDEGKSPQGCLVAGGFSAWPYDTAPAIPERSRADYFTYDAISTSWRTHFAEGPPFLRKTPLFFGSQSAFWLTESDSCELYASDVQASVYYHNDHIGTPIVVSGSSGVALYDCPVHPFGMDRINNCVPRDFQPRLTHRFFGREVDHESKLVNFTRRSFASGTSRFVSTDPLVTEFTWSDDISVQRWLSSPQVAHSNSYGANRPTRFIDPTGLENVDNAGGSNKQQITINVFLSSDRDKVGKFRVSLDGELVLSGDALGRASSKAAKAAGNEHMDSLKTMGHTPTGTWDGKLRDEHTLELSPVSGDASLAESRTNIQLHDFKGRTSFSVGEKVDMSLRKGLLSTNGCVRVSDESMKELTSIINAAREKGEVSIKVIVHDVQKRGGPK